MRSLSSDDIHYSPKGLFGQSKNLYCYQKWGLGRSPKRVVSRWCRCVVQRLCATDCKHPCLVRAAAPHSAPARMPGVYAQGLCTMQSQPSIHSLSPRGKGFGVRDREFALSYKIQTFSTNLRHRISGAFVVIIDLFILSSSALKLCKAQGMILLYRSMYHEDLCRIRQA